VGLVDDGPGDRPDPIEKRRSRILVRQPRGDRVHRLSARRSRANQLEEVPRLAPFEMQMREKQMLVQPAADQTLPRARCIQQALPRLDLGSLLRRWLKRLLIHLGTLLQ